MRLENILRFEGEPNASGLFYARGSFGIIDSGRDCTRTRQGNVTTFSFETETVSLTATFTQTQNGLVIREDCLQNLSDKPVEINALSSRFCLDGCDYEVYTQFNGWQHESRGGWQPLVTQVTTAAQGVRSCESATPMMALHNLHSGRNTVFHLFPNAQWKMTARKVPESKKEIVVVETGFYSENMRLMAAPGEVIRLPSVWFFDAKSKTDLDAWKLHEVYHERYPRKRLPVTYNSWLYCFDNLDVDALLKQVDCAAELGIEAFMIDAGWFGTGDSWWTSVGDWEENAVGGPKGRLIEISERVRQKEMVFGLWFEPERADPHSKAVAAHPDFYINNSLLDFANPAAVEYMLEILTRQIKHYSIGWIKFDFNASIPVDLSGSAFYRYMEGQRYFVETLRERFPHLYLTNCASGGYRMELEQGTMFDSFWLSDNQGPCEGIRIVKDTLKRMPSSLIERWNVQQYADGFPRHAHKGTLGVMFNCNDATWESILNVDDSFAQQFTTGGPIGFSCDLVSMPQQYKDAWKAHIARFKSDRDFYAEAAARVLVDTPDIIAIQYADIALNRCIIQLFTKTVYADDLIVCPVLDAGADYLFNGETVSGKETAEDGIRFTKLADNHCYTAELVKR